MYQWQICSDNNNYRGVCLGCDIGLNRAVLEFMKHPEAEKLSKEYEQKKLKMKQKAE